MENDAPEYMIKLSAGIFVSTTAMAQYGEHHCAEMLGLVKRWPVRTSLSSNSVVMVEGATNEEAISKYLSWRSKQITKQREGV